MFYCNFEIHDVHLKLSNLAAERLTKSAQHLFEFAKSCGRAHNFANRGRGEIPLASGCVVTQTLLADLIGTCQLKAYEHETDELM